MVVDDEPSILEVFELIYSDNYRIITASNGVDAIKKFQEEDIDGIITDFNMPELDGVEFLKELNSRYHFSEKKKPSCFMMTGNSALELSDVAPLGVRALFDKPLNYDIFSKILNFYTSDRFINGQRRHARSACPSSYKMTGISNSYSVVNISQAGLCVSTKSDQINIKPGDLFPFKLLSNDPSFIADHCQGKAVCRWVDHRIKRIGIEFVYCSQVEQNILKIFNQCLTQIGEFY